MKNLFKLLAAAFLTLVLIGCQKEQYSPIDNEQVIYDKAVSRANAVVPFHGEYTTYPVPGEFDPVNMIQYFYIPGVGTALHLGKSTWTSNSAIYLGGEPPFVQTGTNVFVSANGDSLVGAFTGTTAPTEYSPFVGTGDYWIDYGTGRFTGYTGSGTYSYVVAADFSYAKLQFTGILNKP